MVSMYSTFYLFSRPNNLSHMMNLHYNIEKDLYHAKFSHLYISQNFIRSHCTKVGPNSVVTCPHASSQTIYNNTKPNEDRNNENLEVNNKINATFERPSTTSQLTQRWKDLHGLNQWKGLLDPLDIDLRKNILHYGELAQACYNSFDTDEHSKYTGTCKFSKDEFFEKVGLVKGKDAPPFGYKIVRYLYACCSIDMPQLVMMRSRSREPWSKQSNWIGYVAVSTDEATNTWLGRRDIVVVWRGTIRPLEWIQDFDFRQADITPLLPKSSSSGGLIKKDEGQPQVVRGWLALYTSRDPQSPFTTNSARDQALNEVRYQLRKYIHEDVSITISGHSLGAALATINAFDIGLNGINLRKGRETTLVTAIVFASPRVGDADFRKKFESLKDIRVLKVQSKDDLVTTYPPWIIGYRDIGEEIMFDMADSPHLKKSKSKVDLHNLEGYLHMVAGTHGVGKPFKLQVNRDLSLVNKSRDLLRDDYLIPDSWWQVPYKGMVQRDDGSWYLPDRDKSRIPKPEPLNDI